MRPTSIIGILIRGLEKLDFHKLEWGYMMELHTDIGDIDVSKLELDPDFEDFHREQGIIE
jgi:hypothetical protein